MRKSPTAHKSIPTDMKKHRSQESEQISQDLINVNNNFLGFEKFINEIAYSRFRLKPFKSN